MTKKITFVSLLMIALLAVSCSKRQEQKVEVEQPKVDTTAVLVMQAQKCSRLYTTEYRMHKVITHDDQLSLKGKVLNHDYDVKLPLGERKVAIPVDATVKAYIDFANFSAENVVRDSSHIEIILPDPHIILSSSRINHNDIQEYVALTRSRFTDAELSAFEQQGRQAIIADIGKTNILESARIGAANVLVPMLQQMGFKAENITISFRHDLTKHGVGALIDKTTVEKKKK